MKYLFILIFFPLICFGQYSDDDVYVIKKDSSYEHDYDPMDLDETTFVYSKSDDKLLNGYVIEKLYGSSTKSYFKNGLRHGKEINKSFGQGSHNTGELISKSEFNYSYGIRIGWLKCYWLDEKSNTLKLTMKVFYKNGRKTGKEEHFDLEGNITRVVNY